jgi:hypothetical protein
MKRYIIIWFFKKEQAQPVEPIALFKFCAPVLRETGAGKSAIPQRMFEFPWKHAGLFSGGGKNRFFTPFPPR